MTNLLRSLRILGLVSVLVIGMALNDASADDGCSPKNPLRGLWSLRQDMPFVLPPGVANPFPATEVGNVIIDECGNFTGEAIFNAPSLIFPFDYFGSCGNPDENKGLFDCTVNSLQVGLVNGGRACVASARRGECFNKINCVISNAEIEPGIVIMAEFTRQKSDTCQ